MGCRARTCAVRGMRHARLRSAARQQHHFTQHRLQPAYPSGVWAGAQRSYQFRVLCGKKLLNRKDGSENPMQIHYFGAARAAAGVAEETLAEAPGTLGELLELLAATHTGTTDAGSTLGEIFNHCSFLVDSTRTDDTSLSLTGASRVDVMPPFAGG